LMVTHGAENSELATIPFVMAVTAQASDVDVLMGFQGNGVMLTVKGMVDHVAASGFPPLKDLLKTYTEGGGKIYVCGPCVGSRKIAQPDMVEGAALSSAPRRTCPHTARSEKLWHWVAARLRTAPASGEN
jgi:predicted peroxiredoxin